MSFSHWIKKVIFPVEGSTAEPTAATASTPTGKPAAPLPRREPAPKADAKISRPTIGALDREETATLRELTARETDVLRRLGERIRSGEFRMHELPTTSVATLEMANRSSVELKQLIDAVGRDPVLASEMLRVANSALYATEIPAHSLQQAVMRIGLNNVRGVVFTAGMKSALRGSERVKAFSEEVWRQAQSVALIARVIGGRSDFDPELAYMVGLLHDIGKIVVLSLLDPEVKELARPTPTLIARAFREHHEYVGAAMAAKWKLPPEIVAVAGAHHDLDAKLEYPRETALAWLAHEIDVRMSSGDDEGCRALITCKALDLLGVAAEEDRFELLETSRRAWEANESVRS